MRRITYAMDVPSPRVEYTIQFLLASQGFSPRRSAPELADIYYGAMPAPSSFSRIQIQRDPRDLIWRELLDGNINASSLAEVVPFDLIGASAALLTDSVHQGVGPRGFDRHARLRYDASVQKCPRIGASPLVNRYASFLHDLIKLRLGVEPLPLWPRGKVCAIALSHDVDIPEKYALLRGPMKLWPGDPARTMRYAARKIVHGLKRARDPSPEDWWLFDQIMTAEESLGFRSTFFAASVNCFSDWGAEWDVYYDSSSPRFRRQFEDIIRRGFSIGLHASYEAWKHLEWLAYERHKLERDCGGPVRGVRHHYWHLGPDVESTLLKHEEAGFAFDTSIAFNEHLGFRRGVALPYLPWLTEQNRPVRVLQIPVFCMDGNLFYQPTTVRSAVDRVGEFVTALKQAAGIASIDWHVRSSYPANTAYRSWGEAYLQILHVLASDDSVWVTTPENIVDWWTARSTRLMSDTHQ
jgi:hypothetical protein